MVTGFSPKNLSQSQIIAIATLASLVVIGIIIVLVNSWSGRSRSQIEELRQGNTDAPSVARERQVKRVLLRKVLEDGTVVFYEILGSGEVNIYDQDMNLIQSGIQGYYKVDNLFNKLNRNLESLLNNKQTGNTAITIETNKGSYTIYIDDDEDLNQIVEEVEDIVEEPFLPTPTPPPTNTPVPGQPTNTPFPTLPPPTNPPAPTIPGATPTPTPLPDYMTAPPFSCDQYDDFGKPITISNVVCGLP